MANRYVNVARAYMSPRRTRGNPKNVKGVRSLFLGARVEVDETQIINGLAPAKIVGASGFIRVADLAQTQRLKVFFLDVGQGDSVVIEAEGAMVVIDGGPNDRVARFLRRRNKARLDHEKMVGNANPPVQHIDAVIISHFDIDHYTGIGHILKDDRFSVGTIYHNGLPRYHDDQDKDLNLGSVQQRADGTSDISVDIDSLASAEQLRTSGALASKFAGFIEKASIAAANGRLGGMQRLDRGALNTPAPTIPNLGPELQIEVLAPLPISRSNATRLPCFSNPHGGSSLSESHTINGNSVVLRLTYGNHTFLMGGDLNQPSQRFLIDSYAAAGIAPFQADVNKACHHGSADFDLGYLQAVQPHATVFSSGDNGTHDHPFANAIGAASKASQGDFPLVFSTELAREDDKPGHINARSNGNLLVMAQKKEKPSLKKKWHMFSVPHTDPFEEL